MYHIGFFGVTIWHLKWYLTLCTSYAYTPSGKVLQWNGPILSSSLAWLNLQITAALGQDNIITVGKITIFARLLPSRLQPLETNKFLDCMFKVVHQVKCYILSHKLGSLLYCSNFQLTPTATSLYHATSSLPPKTSSSLEENTLNAY